MPDYEDRMTEENEMLKDSLRKLEHDCKLLAEDRDRWRTHAYEADERHKAQLAAMTERKDGWRKVAMEWRERLRELYPELRDELAWTHRRQVNIANEDTKEWSMDRREARNGQSD